MLDLEALKREARAKRASLPARNRFTIGELQRLPPFFDWVECRAAEGVRFRMFAGHDDAVALRFYWNGEYEAHALRLWTGLSRSLGGIRIDVGAHTGAYTLASLAARPDGRVLSFEPHFMNFARLGLNLRANGFPMRDAHPRAVGAAAAEAVFSISTAFDFLTTGGSLGAREGGTAMPVRVVALDEVLAEASHREVRLVKIDVEGGEADCLRGMQRILEASRPVVFFECLADEPGAQVEALLRPLGYRFHEVDDDVGTVSAVDKVVPVLDGEGRPVKSRLNRIASTDPAFLATLPGAGKGD